MLTPLDNYPRISVITPNYNQGDFIEQTIRSVINQNYPNLEYIIIDGGSNDNSIEIIKKYQNDISYWVSEKDKGMYDAINKGFNKSTGQIMCWLNSDDVFWENSLFKVANLFIKNTNINWLQGYPSVINTKGAVIAQRQPVSSKYYFYFNKYRISFKFIQQESTFWSRTLWDKSGAFLDTNYNLAADFDLWMRFFKYSTLCCTPTQLSAFRVRNGQKSADKLSYLKEANQSIQDNFKSLNLCNKIGVKILNYFRHSNIKIVRQIVLKLQVLIVGKPIYVN